MVTYYAWAPIAHKNKEGKDITLNPGDEVKSDFLDSMDDDELVETWKKDGVIRTAKFPTNVPLYMSVRNHLLRLANDEFERATRIGSPQPEVETQAPAQEAEDPLAKILAPHAQEN